MEFKELLKSIIDLGFPVGVCVWLLYRDFRRFSYMERAGNAAISILERITLQLDTLNKVPHARPNLDK